MMRQEKQGLSIEGKLLVSDEVSSELQSCIVERRGGGCWTRRSEVVIADVVEVLLSFEKPVSRGRVGAGQLEGAI